MSDDGERESSGGPLDSHIGAGVFDETMGPGSSFAHLYRGEIHRMKSWRERLDRTSNWAITLMAGILTWSFSAQTHPHYIILLGVVTLCIFLAIEARRFRAYDIWRSRVRMFQQNVFAYALDPEGGVVDEDWRQKLGEDYRKPNMKIPFEEALAHRLRRVYLPLFLVMLAAWVIQLTAYTDSTTFVTSAGVGTIPGNIVVAFVAGFYATLIGITFRPREWHVNGELIPSDVTGWEQPEYADS
ncbi:DUF2270 domain-containing protein [Haloferax mediterranei ATCC 33500]|uniref:DUF2270 domain-containing protein n=1 Tax=Haloferax mediterranei (strain ATCC 33500 / DSM 1411 / JCM 8866 / NBRC 14739 / NCIMB 2177 / R-4) TaxID=523841 RepID=I3R1T6_HALMT|nr:DUF2270 domain-containing protein [Haloferax mediterranei]AFK18196.1 putative membrane protein [Haloferax mediterranei ATCC 33500]EMA02530.1 hypothetical protein C439_08105 [Haloferax mediterranei ATCC 33500]MDX5988286.1 DUF2270 domain-containing protein [Haloferax mediterranei ATCC 33500]QCQ74723.1 DUF2270 domain-containing protein [Haloferax mediterranei ATCC 33500]